MMIDKESCFYYGSVKKLLGHRGEVSIAVEGEIPENLEIFRYFHLDLKDGLVPFFIEEADVRGSQLLRVKFMDVPSQEKARRILSCPVYLEKKQFDELVPSGIFSSEMVGYQVSDSKLGPLGRVVQYLHHPGQDLLEVEIAGKELLIPVVPEIILKTDHKKKVIFVDLPEGLVDLNG